MVMASNSGTSPVIRASDMEGERNPDTLTLTVDSPS